MKTDGDLKLVANAITDCIMQAVFRTRWNPPKIAEDRMTTTRISRHIRAPRAN
jgi:hypothetical protein